MAVFSPEIFAQRFQPGDVVDVQPGDYDFGADIPRLGWWRVISCTGPAGIARGLMAGDLLEPGEEHRTPRLRTRRLDLTKLENRMTVEQLIAAAVNVPTPTLQSIG